MENLRKSIIFPGQLFKIVTLILGGILQGMGLVRGNFKEGVDPTTLQLTEDDMLSDITITFEMTALRPSPSVSMEGRLSSLCLVQKQSFQ